MEFSELIQKRQSDRKYKDEAVCREDIVKCLEAKAGALVKSKDYSMIDLGIAVENFCLQATELGLGTCIIGWFDEKRVKKLLGVPRSRRIQVLISLGHPDAPTRNKVRKPLEEMSSWGKY